MKTKLLSLMLFVIGFTSFSQNNLLYTISRNVDSLVIYDTTGGTFNIYASRFISGAGHTKSIGLVLNPNSNEMFILFEDGNGEGSRRIGSIDTLTGVITDVGMVGNMQHLAYDFTTSTLYSVGANAGAIAGLYEVDQSTGVATLLPATPGGYGSAIVYDYYIDSMTMARSTSFHNINLTDLNSSSVSHSFTDEGAGAVIINDSITWVYGRAGPLRAWNKNTLIYTDLLIDFGNSTHSMTFGTPPLLVTSSNGKEFCSADGTVLSTSSTGTTYQWGYNGSPIVPAETNATLVPTLSGTYSCMVDGKLSLSITINILPSPVVSFTATPNPVDLAVDPTGNVDFVNTSTSGHAYDWDLGNGFTTMTENPSFPYTSVGSFMVTFTVTDTINGCSASMTQTIDVNNTTGIAEINDEFSIYPNPTNGKVSVKVNSEFDGYTATVLDMNGRELNSFILNKSTGNSFNLSNETSGVYLLRISNGDIEVFQRIVKK